MAGTLARGAPTPEIVLNMIQGSGGTGTLFSGLNAQRLAFNATSTGNANMAWINPESGTVIAKAYLCWTTAGTGTFDMGRQADGTGSASDMIVGGTMAIGVFQQVTTATVTAGTVGEVNKGHWLLGPGGTGTNNSIVVKVTDTITSTAKGFLVVEYLRIEP